MIGFLGVLFSINYRLGRLSSADEFLREDGVKTRELVESSKREIQEQMRSDVQQLRSESEQTRGEIRRLADAMVSHHHDSDGTTVFRIPPA